MKTKTTVTETVATENEPVTGELSEQQEQILANEGETIEATTETETVEGVVEDGEALGEDFEALEKAYGDNEIDEQPLLMAVKEGRLTPKGFTAICNLEYIDNQEPDNRSLVDKWKDSLIHRLGMGAIPPTKPIAPINAYNLIKQEVDQKRMSETEAKILKDWLDVTVSDPLIREIKKHHAELTSLTAICDAATSAANNIVRQSVEMETTKLSQLVNAFADYAIYKLDAGQISPSADMANDLWNEAKKDKLLGDPDPKNNQVKDDNNAVVAVNDLYSDPTISSYRYQVCKAACLVCLESVSKVQFGYIPKDQVTARLNVRNVFQPADKINIPLEECLRDVCAPANILKPDISVSLNPEIERDGKMIKVNRLEKSRDNPDTSLRRLSKVHIDALYAHHFNGEELTYDVENESKVPTGYINGSKPKGAATTTPTTTRVPRGSTTGTDKVKALEEKVKEKEAESKKKDEDIQHLRAMVETKDGDAGMTCNTLAAFFRDDTAPLPVPYRVSFLKAVQAFVQRIKRSTEPLTESEASLLLDISVDLSAVFEVTNDDGTECKVYTADGVEREYKNPKVTIDGKGNGITETETKAAA